MELIRKYLELGKQIHDYFEYEENGMEIPLRDATKFYWFLSDREKHNSKCVRSEEPFTEKSIQEGTNIYSGLIYTQRFLPKWVYRKSKYTMIAVNTITDGNKFLMIFDNVKECKDPELVKLYKNHW